MLETKGFTLMSDERNYRAFLVRMWTASQDGEVVWRASAQDAHTGGCRGFADLAGLFAFLKEVTETSSGRQVGEAPPSSAIE